MDLMNLEDFGEVDGRSESEAGGKIAEVDGWETDAIEVKVEAEAAANGGAGADVDATVEFLVLLTLLLTIGTVGDEEEGEIWWVAVVVVVLVVTALAPFPSFGFEPIRMPVFAPVSRLEAAGGDEETVSLVELPPDRAWVRAKPVKLEYCACVCM